MNKFFFQHVRVLFPNGKLTQGQVDGMNLIINYAKANGYSRLHLAYMLATIQHETANWMEPIREGARRYGRKYSDASARRAVAAIHAKGIIRRNYALPDKNGNSYYGRGLVQITHGANYKKTYGETSGADLYANPDLALDWKPALDIAFIGCRDGMFTGKKLSQIKGLGDFRARRDIVNGDVKKYGAKLRDHGTVFYDALRDYDTLEPEVAPEAALDNSTPSNRPGWWPF